MYGKKFPELLFFFLKTGVNKIKHTANISYYKGKAIQSLLFTDKNMMEIPFFR